MGSRGGPVPFAAGGGCGRCESLSGAPEPACGARAEKRRQELRAGTGRPVGAGDGRPPEEVKIRVRGQRPWPAGVARAAPRGRRIPRNEPFFTMS